MLAAVQLSFGLLAHGSGNARSCERDDAGLAILVANEWRRECSLATIRTQDCLEATGNDVQTLPNRRANVKHTAVQLSFGLLAHGSVNARSCERDDAGLAILAANEWRRECSPAAIRTQDCLEATGTDVQTPPNRCANVKHTGIPREVRTPNGSRNAAFSRFPLLPTDLFPKNLPQLPNQPAIFSKTVSFVLGKIAVAPHAGSVD